MRKDRNIALSVDSYKGSHHLQMPPDAEVTRYYVAPRKALSPKAKDFVIFGVTHTVITYLLSQMTLEKLTYAKFFWDRHGVGGRKYPFPEEGFRYIIEKYNGYLPITIKGLREGVPFTKYNVPVMLIECADPKLVWLSGFIETFLQRGVWYPSTVVNVSREVRRYLKRVYAETVNPDMHWSLDSRLHDFGARGAHAGEDAGIGGLAHLINFNGTDTIEALVEGYEVYGILPDELGTSIPAAEHSTVTSWGHDQAAERAALLNMIEQFKDEPLFAFVSDSYDYKDLVDNVWGDPEIIAKIRANGTIPVVRPDSGDPEEMVLYALRSLEKSWGATKNAAGLKVLNGIRIIQGDGMRLKTIIALYDAVIAAGYSPENLAIGMGGGLMEQARDDMSWSMKMYQIKRDGHWHDVQKKPKTQEAKKGWDPTQSLDWDQYITYYRHEAGMEVPETLAVGVEYFRQVRENARAL